MSRILLIVSLLLSVPAFPQGDAAALAQQLTSGKETDREKVTAIFTWITSNISYRVGPPNRFPVIGSLSLRNAGAVEEDDSPLLPLNERVSETVLRRGTAVCDGYARLFTTLCGYAGIRSEVIVGFARSNAGKPARRFGVNHYWNAVQIGNDWYLLDATWASGYIADAGDRFVREYDAHYFLTPPEEFIRDHYPDDPRWTLLPDAKLPEEFRHSPFKQKSFTKYRITSYAPATGIIEAAIGDTIRLKLQTPETEHLREVAPDLLVDSAFFSYSPNWVFLRPSKEEMEKGEYRYEYEYAVARPGVEWLYLLYNDDLVLRYKLQVNRAVNSGRKKRRG